MVGRGDAVVAAGVEETEDERRERLLAILKRRPLLLQKDAAEDESRDCNNDQAEPE